MESDSTQNRQVLASLLKRDMGRAETEGSPYRVAILNGMLTKTNTIRGEMPIRDRSMFSQVKWRFLLDAPFEVSNQCCRVMKKDPAHRYAKESGRVAFTAQMADESRLRQQQWLKYGCNAFDNKNPVSNPMSFWTEQDVLLYIKDNNLQICSVYGDIVSQDEEGFQYFESFGEKNLTTTGCKRTGCMFCGFGCHMKGDTRFVDMKKTHPKQYEWIMKPLEDGGLNYKNVIDWLNEHGNLSIKY